MGGLEIHKGENPLPVVLCLFVVIAGFCFNQAGLTNPRSTIPYVVISTLTQAHLILLINSSTKWVSGC